MQSVINSNIITSLSLILVFFLCTACPPDFNSDVNDDQDEWQKIITEDFEEKCDCVRAYDIIATEILRFMDEHHLKQRRDRNLDGSVGSAFHARILKLNDITDKCKAKFNPNAMLNCPHYREVAEKLDYIYGLKEKR